MSKSCIRLVRGFCRDFARSPAMRGASLFEVMASIGIASLLTTVLVVLFMHSQIIYHGEDSRSDELREMDKAMGVLSDKLSHDRIFILSPLDKLATPEGSSRIELEQFLQTYQLHRIFTIALSDNNIIEEDYPSSKSSLFLQDVEKPDSREILGRFIHQVRFRLIDQQTLEITVEGETLKLGTEISRMRIAGETP